MEDTDTESMDTNTDTESMDTVAYELEYNELLRLFPDIRIRLSFSLKYLDETLSTLDKIYIDNDINCCQVRFNVEVQPIEYIVVFKKQGNTYITFRDVVQKLNDIHYTKHCDHMFLEDFYQEKNTENIFGLIFGS